MAASTNTKCWEKLAAIPKTGGREQSQVVFDNQRQSLYAIHEETGLLQYYFDRNIWNTQQLSNKLPSHFFYGPLPIAIDSQNKVYLGADNEYGSYVATLQINLSSLQTWNINVVDHRSYGSKAVWIDDELHFIGGYSQGKHLRYNKITQRLDKLHEIDFGFAQLIKMKHKLVAIGGYRRDYLNGIHEYDMNKNIWIKCKETFPRSMIIDGSAIVLNEQYIILFGGYDTTNINNIWIYCVADKIFKESKIKCPGKRGGKVFKLRHPERDELAIYGYIRQCKNVSLPSRDIVNMINEFYMNEWIHLIETKGKPPRHWRINVFDIINNAE